MSSSVMAGPFHSSYSRILVLFVLLVLVVVFVLHQEVGIVLRRKSSDVNQRINEMGEAITGSPPSCSCSKDDISYEALPPIYMITPTYRRAEQISELTRTAQTLLHVKNFVWIVVEDAPVPSQEVIDYLDHSGVKYVYLRSQIPERFANVKNKPRGVSNRNEGLRWVRENAVNGVVYFGDDDNTYDLRVFEEMRSTKKISMFPVGFVTKLGVSSPIVRGSEKEGYRVIGFYDGWIANRTYPVDMAGFAFTVELLHKFPKADMPFVVGYEEDGILKSLGVKPSDIEVKADHCTKIWVWHTQTKKNAPVSDATLLKDLQDTNIFELRKILWRGI